MEYDVIVVGLGTAGAQCTITSARHSMNVLGIEEMTSLGGMAAAAWISTFPRSRVGAGAALIVAGVVLEIAASSGSAVLTLAAWPLFYLGNLVMATGVTGELRMRQDLR